MSHSQDGHSSTKTEHEGEGHSGEKMLYGKYYSYFGHNLKAIMIKLCMWQNPQSIICRSRKWHSLNVSVQHCSFPLEPWTLDYLIIWYPGCGSCGTGVVVWRLFERNMRHKIFADLENIIKSKPCKEEKVDSFKCSECEFVL